MSPVPRAVTWLIALLAPRDSRESLLADLEEEAAARAVRDGSRRARRWCWGQLAGSIGPLAGRRVAACVHLSGFVPRLFWRRLPHDAALSIRRLAQAPAFTAISGLTLALGIGGATAVFTLVDRVMLQRLPVPRPGELYRLGSEDNCCVTSGLQNSHSLFSYDLYRHLRDNSPGFSDLAAFQPFIMSVNVRRPGTMAAEPVPGQFVSGNYFQMFGLPPMLGRTIAPSDDRPGARPVAMLSHRAWVRRFEAHPAAVGQVVAINGLPFTIVGVAPPEFYGDMLRPNPPELWLPIGTEPALAPEARLIASPATHWLYLIGRLRPGSPPGALAPHATALLRQWLSASHDLPETDRSRIAAQEIRVVSAALGVGSMRSQVAPALGLLLAISAVVLVIACANLGNLLLARGLGRRVEFAVRIALGAPRGRLIVEATIDSVVLACAGGLAGLAVAYGGARGIVALAFSGAPHMPIDPSPSLPVLAFATGVSLVTGVAIGLVPAVIASRTDPIDAMRGAGRVTGDRGPRLRQALVTLQIALSLALVAGAGLMARSLANLQRQDFGFRTEGRYVAVLNTALADASPARLDAIYQVLSARLRRIPGVASAAFSLYSPMEGDNWIARITVDGRPPSERLSASWNRVSPGYFETLGTPLLRGRLIDARDRPSGGPVAVVSETFARRFFGDASPVGRRFGFAGRDGGGTRDVEIVGVVADAKYQDARRPPTAMFFLPFLQRPHVTVVGLQRAEAQSNIARRLELRLAALVPNLEAEVRRALADVDPGFTVVAVLSLDEQVRRNFNGERLIATLTSVFGAMALLLASLGLYGVIAQAVTARTRELGVRVALGATRGRIVTTVLRGAFVQVACGFALGGGAALAAGRLLEAQLYGVSGRDPRVLAFSALVLAGCVTVAAVIPALRAATLDPLDALRRDG